MSLVCESESQIDPLRNLRLQTNLRARSRSDALRPSPRAASSPLGGPAAHQRDGRMCVAASAWVWAATEWLWATLCSASSDVPVRAAVRHIQTAPVDARDEFGRDEATDTVTSERCACAFHSRVSQRRSENGIFCRRGVTI